MYAAHEQPQFQQPMYNGYAQAPPNQNEQSYQYPPPPAPVMQAPPYPPQQNHNNNEFLQAQQPEMNQQLVPHQQQYQQQIPPYPVDPQPMRQGSQPFLAPPGAVTPYQQQDQYGSLAQQPPYRDRTGSQVSRHSHESRHSHQSHQSHQSHHSRNSHSSQRSRRSKSPIPERATLGDTLVLIWEAFKGAFERRRV